MLAVMLRRQSKYQLTDIKRIVKRIFNSALRTLGFLTILFAIAVTVLTGGYGLFLGLYVLGVGILIYIIDFLVTRFIKDRKVFWRAPLVLTITYLLFCIWVYMMWQEHNAIIFPDNFKGQAGIIFGIEGYPPLPETKFWKKTIEFPDNGIIITSTKQEEIPNTIRYYFISGKGGDYNQIFWDANSEYYCIVNNSVIKTWLFTFDNQPTLQVKKRINELINEINIGKAKSAYTTDNRVLVENNKGKYLWLQDKNLDFIPVAVSNLNIYKVILTSNNFTEIPKQILSIKALEDLTIGHNPITEISPDINKLKRLKSLTLNATNIKEIKTDLSNLDSLEHFDFSDNETSFLPDQVKNIPNLTWLLLNDNKFQDISFIDARLQKLEMLYLYTNKIKKISVEIKLLPNLKELVIFDNQIDSIPDCISALTNLERFEIWNNPIKYISPEIKKLQKLKEMRIDDDYLTEQDKQNLKIWLPNCTIHFQTRKEK